MKQYTEKELIAFGNYILSEEREKRFDNSKHTESKSEVHHADLENWKAIDLENNKIEDLQVNEVYTLREIQQFCVKHSMSTITRGDNLFILRGNKDTTYAELSATIDPERKYLCREVITSS